MRRAAQATIFTGDRGEVRKVRACAERAGRASDDEHLCGFVSASLRDGLDELAKHGVGHCVLLLGTVDGDGADAIGHVV